MTISPLDIKKEEFGKKFKGYDPDEVDSYLQLVADEMELLLKENNELHQKAELLEGKISNYSKIENVLQDTLLNTQKSAEETKIVAEKQASSIIADAELQAEKLLSEAREKLISIRTELTELKNQKDLFIVNFKSLISTQRTLLDLVEKRSEKGEAFYKIKMKADLSNEELDKVVNDFAAESGLTENMNDSENNKPSDFGGDN